MLPKLTEMEQNWIMFTPYGLTKNLWQIYLRDSLLEFTGKNNVAIPCEQDCGLIGQKQQNSFQ